MAFLYGILYIITRVTRKLKVMWGPFTDWKIALLSEMSLFSWLELYARYHVRVMDPNTHHSHFQFDFLCLASLITWKLQVICWCSTCVMTALLLEMFIFCVRPGCEIWMASYISEHISQSLSNKPFFGIQCTYTQNFKTSGHMWTFSISNDCYIIGDIFCVV